MAYKQSLTRRIVIFFMMMTAAIGGLVAVGMVGVIHVTEERLLTRQLGNDLERVIHTDMIEGHRPSLDPSMRLMISDAEGIYAMPSAMARLPEGLHEVYEDPLSYHALIRDIDGRRFVLLQDQSDYVAREKTFYLAVAIGYIITVMLSGLLGWLLARKVMAPVIRLARQVRNRDQLQDTAPPLSKNYADDEVGALAVSFDETLGQLRDALTREKLFTSDVSHELRTPLMVIGTSCELMEAEPSLTAKSRAQLERMMLAVREMHHLVQTFLQLARAQRNDEEMAVLATLPEVAENLLDVWREPVRQKGLQLILRYDAKDDRLYNEVLLYAVMGNLLRNAVHYTDEGQINVVLRDGGFSVADTGAGIPVEQRERVFMPFIRGASAARGEGFGLGLSLVKRICAAKNWTVSLFPVEPHGCCFDVSLNGDGEESR